MLAASSRKAAEQSCVAARQRPVSFKLITGTFVYSSLVLNDRRCEDNSTLCALSVARIRDRHPSNLKIQDESSSSVWHAFPPPTELLPLEPARQY